MEIHSRKVALPFAAAAVAALGLMTVGASPAVACPDMPYVGAVCATAITFCPSGYVEADGRQLQIQTNAALYSLLSSTFGGDRQTVFNVPDLRGRAVSAWGVLGDTNMQNVQWGAKYGVETLPLTANNLPQHTHAATFTAGANGGLQATATWTVEGSAPTATNGSATPTNTNNVFAGNAVPSTMWASGSSTPLNMSGITVNVTGAPVGSVTNGFTGAATAPTAMAPSMPLKYCIATSGEYPSRPW